MPILEEIFRQVNELDISGNTAVEVNKTFTTSALFSNTTILGKVERLDFVPVPRRERVSELMRGV